MCPTALYDKNRDRASRNRKMGRDHARRRLSEGAFEAASLRQAHAMHELGGAIGKMVLAGCR
jgi:hypothetical protein